MKITLEALQILIEKGEGTHLEFKRVLSKPAKVAKTLSAFANTGGGYLVVGVADNGQITGLEAHQLPSETEKLNAAAAFSCNPPVAVKLTVINVSTRSVLVAEVPESLTKPHVVSETSFPTAYIRAAAQSIPAGPEMVKLLKNTPASRFVPRTPHEKALLAYLQRHGRITVAELCRLLNLSERRATRMLRELAGQGVLLVQEHEKTPFYSLR